MNTDTIIAITAIAAIIISVISMVFTVVFSIQQMKHNKNSVRPICDIKINDYENLISVAIANFGTGPLIIKKIICKDAERTSQTLLSLMPHINQLWTTFTEDVTGWTIPVDGKIVLIELHPDNDNDKYRVRSALEKTTIEVTYTDIYGSANFEKSRKLDFFGRTLGMNNRHYDSNYSGETKVF